MARTRDEDAYASTRGTLLDAGVTLIRARSYADVGINDVLIACNVPKGSFYHYFRSKEDFGLSVATHYHDAQMASAKAILGDEREKPIRRVRAFFATARKDFARRNYGDGCLMCNLSTELGDQHPAFQALLARQWKALAVELAQCLGAKERRSIGLGHLSSIEAADMLLNAWSGALVRMKAERSAKPLRLFEKTFFNF